jgi:hypothetical protein
MNDGELNQMLSRDEEANVLRDFDIVKEHFAFNTGTGEPLGIEASHRSN